jgi:hypothetical protein
MGDDAGMNMSTIDDLQAAKPLGPTALLELTHELEEQLRIWNLRMAIAGEDVTAEIVEALAKLRAFLSDKPR